MEKIHYQISRTIWRGWRAWLHYSGGALQWARRLFQRTFSGFMGAGVAYEIHSKPMVSEPEEIEISVDNLSEEERTALLQLILDTEKQFQQGAFFHPLAEQTLLTGAVITTRIQQGEVGKATDHLAVIFPVKE